jgi:hypothetical protein
VTLLRTAGFWEIGRGVPELFHLWPDRGAPSGGSFRLAFGRTDTVGLVLEAGSIPGISLRQMPFSASLRRGPP